MVAGANGSGIGFGFDVRTREFAEELRRPPPAVPRRPNHWGEAHTSSAHATMMSRWR